MTVSVDELFSEICRERGGVDSLSAVQLAIARSLAICLSNEPVNAGTVAALSALLPASKTGKRIDLRKLSDREINVIERLVKRATVAGSLPDETEAANAAAWEAAVRTEGELRQRLAHAELCLQRYEKKDATWRSRAVAAEAEVTRLQAALEAALADRPAAAAPHAAAKAPAASVDNVIVIKPQQYWSDGSAPGAPSDPAYNGDGGAGRGRP